MMLLGAASYALYGLLIRRWQLPFGPWLNLYLQILLAVLLLIPVALSADSLAIPAQGWSMVLFAGLASSIFAAYCWMRASPPWGGAHFGLHEPDAPVHGPHRRHHPWGAHPRLSPAGGGLILTGVMLSQLKPRVRRPLPEGA